VRSLASYLRGLDPRLPRAVWLVQAGGVVNALGNGVVFPFAVIYLHNVRGISFAEAGFALAIGGAAALAAGVVAGPLVDRIGGRNTLVLGLLLQAVAFTLFPLIREPWHAFALFALDGVGTACFWPGQSTLLARLTPAEDRHSAYALQRVSMNLGIGLGGRDRRPDRHHRRPGQLHPHVPVRRVLLPRLRRGAGGGAGAVSGRAGGARG
jgi:predicted MFS family arabinose efflux permease